VRQPVNPEPVEESREPGEQEMMGGIEYDFIFFLSKL
jgi:hypothetical protein